MMKPFITKGIILLLFFGSLTSSLVAQDTADTAATSKTQIQEGRKLFTGQIRFANGGAACISCHNIDDPALPLDGGNLAINITSFGGMEAQPLRTRILQTPYPRMAEMKVAYANHPIKKEEANKIIAYMQSLSKQEDTTTASNPMLAGTQFLWNSLIVAILFLGLLWLIWHYRKKDSVNKEIYKRQTKSA